MKCTLKAARINAGYTQKEAAKLLNVSRFTLGNYERGVSFPDIPTLIKIEQVYATKYDKIIFLPRTYG